MTLIHPIILCGGSGTRLWPPSRPDRPLQFQPLLDGRSPVQETRLRVGSEGFARPIVIVNAGHRFVAADQAAQTGTAIDLLLKPEAQGSSAALLVGAAFVTNREGVFSVAGSDRVEVHGPVVLALGADHLVHDADGFAQSCAEARAAAHAGRIVLFGIAPDHPSTTHGYAVGGALPKADGETYTASRSAAAAACFVHKPDEANAGELIAQNALWHSDNVLARAGVLARECPRADAESTATVVGSVSKAARDLDSVRLDPSASPEGAYIPIGATHRLENPGCIPLELIEVQTGSYPGEDDIVRVADAYQRA